MDRKHPLAKCEDCPLYETGKFARDRLVHSEYAVVGEAPGVQEVKDGSVFTGPSGILLRKVLRHYDVDPNATYLTNSVLCRAADGSPPPPAAISCCRDRLIEGLKESGAKTVVALGTLTANSLLHSKGGVTKLRVGPAKYSEELDANVVATFHPAAALRQGDLFPSIVTDVGKIKMPASTWKEPEFHVFDDPQSAIIAMRTLFTDSDALAIDIEVGIDKDLGFDHPDQYSMLCVGLATAEHTYIIGENAFKDPLVQVELKWLVERKAIVAQNGKFDLAGLWNYIGEQPLYFDTMLASYCLDERPGVHGLKYLATEYLGAPDYAADIHKYINPSRDSFALIPRDVLYKYNAYDVRCTYDLYLLQTVRLEEEGLHDLHDHLCKASVALMKAEMGGLKVDIDYLDKLTDEFIASLKVLEDNIVRIYGEPINPRSPQQLKAAFKAMGVTLDSTDKDHLDMLEETLSNMIDSTKDVWSEKYTKATKVLEFVQALKVHRKESKAYGTYVKGIRKRLYRGRVHPTFLLHGTTTGRLSCRNPNLQNIPRGSNIRRLFVPSEPENVFVQADYSQAELRVLTWLAQESYFRDIFNDPSRDLFTELTPVLYGSDAMEGLSAADIKELRIRVKAYVYGLSYGRTEFSIAHEFGISVAEAKKGMQAFFSVIPNIVEFQRTTRKKVMDLEDLVSPFGRHRRFHLITNENRDGIMNEALAFLPQSTSSDMCLTAMINLQEPLRGIGQIRNIVHDSLLIECKPEDAEHVAKLADEYMVASAQAIVGDYVKFATDYKIGNSWGEV